MILRHITHKMAWLAPMALLLLTSCGWDAFHPTIEATSMTLSRHEATVMVGDTLKLELEFEPDSVTLDVAFWFVEGVSVRTSDIVQGNVIAVQPGDSKVICRTINGMLTDTCDVTVIPRWDAFDDSPYQYDMVVYADVEVNGVHNDPNVIVGAFYNDQLRGFGTIMHTPSEGSVTRIRVWHTLPRTGKFTFQYYDRSSCVIGDLDDSLVFDGEMHGTPSNPILIKPIEI